MSSSEVRSEGRTQHVRKSDTARHICAISLRVLFVHATIADRMAEIVSTHSLPHADCLSCSFCIHITSDSCVERCVWRRSDLKSNLGSLTFLKACMAVRALDTCEFAHGVIHRPELRSQAVLWNLSSSLATNAVDGVAGRIPTSACYPCTSKFPALYAVVLLQLQMQRAHYKAHREVRGGPCVLIEPVIQEYAHRSIKFTAGT